MLSYIMLYLRILYHWYYIISPSKTAWIQIEMVPIVSNIIPKVLSSNCQWAMDGKTFMTDDPAWTSRKCSSARNFASSSLRDKALYCSNKVRTTRICWHRQTTTNENKGTYKSATAKKTNTASVPPPILRRGHTKLNQWGVWPWLSIGCFWTNHCLTVGDP